MVRVKICGLRREEDIEVCLKEGVDYLGFILYSKSPRYVDDQTRRKLLPKAEGVKKVAVMVNPSYEEVKSALDEGFDLVQLHGEEGPDLAKRIGFGRVIKAFRVRDRAEIPEVWKKAHAVLLDTYSKKAYGGTGRTFNWDLAKKVVEKGFRVILAGGLTPENVVSALEKVRPFGVDVSSGVETNPGVKDKLKIERFVREVKRWVSSKR